MSGNQFNQRLWLAEQPATNYQHMIILAICFRLVNVPRAKQKNSFITAAFLLQYFC